MKRSLASPARAFRARREDSSALTPTTPRPPAPQRQHRRLGLYSDFIYRVESDPGGNRILTNFEGFPFLTFGCEVARHFDVLVLFGRETGTGNGADYPLLGKTELVALPNYESLRRGLQVLAAVGGTVSAMWRGLPRVDAVVVCGPHPFAFVLALLARLRGRHVVLGVRQDTMRYFRSRLPSPTALPLLAPLWLMDGAFRLLSRWLPTMVTGPYLERRFGGPRPGLHTTRVTLVRSGDVADRPAERNWSAPVQLLAVGRIEPEKDPFLLVDALAELDRERPGSYHLKWAGTGRLVEAVRARAEALGVTERLELLGYIPFGPELLALYRGSHLFVHTALTESFGQVLMEAFACATPVVASDVGGVSVTLDGGAAGLLVPGGDRTALVRAIQRMTDDAELRRRCVVHGLELARKYTLEAEAERLARFISDGLAHPRTQGA